jgi:hypothetical protein
MEGRRHIAVGQILPAVQPCHVTPLFMTTDYTCMQLRAALTHAYDKETDMLIRLVEGI